MKEHKAFDAQVKQKMGEPFTYEDFGVDPALEDFVTPVYEPYEDEDDGEQPTVPDADDVTPDTYDQYVGAEVLLPIGDRLQTGKVTSWKRNADGTPVGKAHTKSACDTRSYIVEFPDGQVNEYTANTIAENMYSQCDAEGNQYLLLEAIVDHRKDGHAVEKADMYIKAGSNRQLRKTTKGWFLCVEWKDGTTSWEKLADLKESNPVEVAEYATA